MRGLSQLWNWMPHLSFLLSIYAWHPSITSCSITSCNIFISTQHRLCHRWPGLTIMLYSWGADEIIHRVWNNVYERWIKQFPRQMKQNSKHKWLEIHAGKDFPPKPLQRRPTKNSSRAEKTTTTRNREAERKPLKHSYKGNVVKTATKNMYRGSDKILHNNYTANETDEERVNTNCRLDLQKGMKISGNTWILLSKLSSSMQG